MKKRFKLILIIERSLLHAALGGMLLAGVVKATPLEQDDSIEYLKGLEIEALLQTEITSVSKKKEKLGDAAAAIFVITAEDIERAGVQSIPDALRMVPGLQVAQISANKWAISSRGFADLFSNKLLVLVDGRSVYTPLFSGVFWEIQDTVIEDIDRIEVIRGPGATLWGANAVNGVINILTKSAGETQGGMVSLGSGSSDSFIASARQGGKIGDTGRYRVYAKGSKHDNYQQTDGEDAYDAWNQLRGGFRTDLEGGAGTRITLQGEVYKGEEQLYYSFPGLLSPDNSKVEADYSGTNLLGRWEKKQGKDTALSLQAYYDYSKIDALIPQENRHTFDLDFQYKTALASIHEVVCGIGYRRSRDDIAETDLFTFDPESRTLQLYSAFLQDEIILVEDRWWLSLGSKFEHNDFSGFEAQPNIRLRWRPVEGQTVWAAVSRAVRTPSRADQDVRANGSEVTDGMGNRYRSALLGRKDFVSEELIAYELGHRWSASPAITFDTALFYNDYDKLRSFDQGSPFVESDSTSAYVVLPLYIGNEVSGKTYGIEFLSTWQPVSSWKVSLGYAYLQVSLVGTADFVLDNQQLTEDDYPQHQVQLRSYYDISADWSFDGELYYVDELEKQGIDSYVRLDLRLGWKINDQIKVSVSGENLTDDGKQEFGTTYNLVGSEVPRRFFAKLTWNY